MRPRIPAQSNKEMSEPIDIKAFQSHDKDTGGSAVQIASLTARILHLTNHMATNKKDVSSRRGLLMLVAKRRRLLDYLKRTNQEAYQKILKDLNLRR